MAKDDPPSSPVPPDRLSSGVAGLDTILQGGFIRSGVYIVQGTPGTGKTIFGHQICFANLRDGDHALYVTLLSENHARMMQQLGGMSFYDAASVPDRLYYISAFSILEDEGLRGLVALIRREAARHQARILVLDGLVAIDELARSSTAFRKFIHELQVVSTAWDCTMFLLASTNRESVSAEHTMVDGIVELSRSVPVARALRFLEVRKFRGSDYIDGRHAIRITNDGIVLYPRLEGLYTNAGITDDFPQHPERVPTGIDRLDAMVGGGLPGASTCLIVGTSGCGKTTLGLHFLKLASRAEPGLYFGFFENPARLLLKARALKLDLKELIDQGCLEVIWHPPTERILDALGNQLIEAVRRRGVRRLFVDGLGGFERAAPSPQRTGPFFTALTNELRNLGCTAFFTAEMSELFSPEVRVPLTGISSFAENIMLMRFVEFRSRLHRMFSVLKLRDSDFDPELREFVIRADGIDLAETFASAEAIMSGLARQAVETATGPGDRRAR